jgi:hypothetical protein
MDPNSSRQDMLLASLMAALPLGLSFGTSDASASPIDPAQTIIKLPADLIWKANPNNPPRSSESCVLTGGVWRAHVAWPPAHQRVVESRGRGTASCVPAPAGSFVRRVAGTPHYDGVIRSHNEPAIIAICGIGPVNYKLTDPSKPGGRAV